MIKLRRWFTILGVLVALLILVVVLAGVGLGLWGRAQYDVYLQSLAELRSQAQAANQAAQTALAEGAFDIQVLVGDDLIKGVAAELDGWRTTSTRGNTILIDQAELFLEDGRIRAEARGSYTFRLGLYSGPANAEYEGFARIMDDGRCRLDMRMVNVNLARETWWSNWLKPWLVVHLQNKMRRPTFFLPLQLDQDIQIPTSQFTVFEDQLTMEVPERAIGVALNEPQILITERGLIVLVDADITEPDTSQPASNLLEADADLSVAIRLPLLRNLLSQVIAPAEDLRIKGDQVDNVWSEQKKVLGMRVKNHADLRNVEGQLDLQTISLEPQADQWAIRLAGAGQISGDLNGRAYGIRVKTPFRAEPSFDEILPFRAEFHQDQLSLVFQDRPLEMDMPIEVVLAGRNVRFRFPLNTTTGKILKPIDLPLGISQEVAIPTYIAAKKVAETRTLRINATWRMVLPHQSEGFLVAHGQITGIEPR